MRLAAAALGCALALVACKQGGGEGAPAPAIPAAELERGRDACKAYVEQACGCARAVPAAQEKCALAKALPESIEVALAVASHPDTTREDAVQSATSIRKAIARCIEQTAQLPALGCAPPGR